MTEQMQRPAIKGADVLQLEREGNAFIFSASRSSASRSSRRRSRTSLSATRCYVGLFALLAQRRRRRDAPSFSNVRIIRPAKDGFVPYRDYIGSDARDARRRRAGGGRSMHTRRDPFQAPNWTPDGKALIYNGSGRGESAAGSIASISRRGSRR